jgi:hypothetical protein
MKDEFKELRTWATVRELEFIEAVEKHGDQVAAAAALGISRGSISSAFCLLRKRAALKGYSPKHDMTKTVPDGYQVKGVSSYYDKDGKLSGQWVKSSADDQRREAIIRQFFETLAADVQGLSPIVVAPAHVEDDLLTVYPFGDPHFGLYAWGKECGADFDLKIAKRVTLGAVDRLIETAPATKTAVMLLLGDVLHMNDQTNQTPAHKHQLDADTRFLQVIEVGVETFRHAALRMLQKHEHVIVKVIPGNHDPEAHIAIVIGLAGYFHNEPRITVDRSSGKHWFYRFGQVLLGSTHGDTVKQDQLLGVMACDRAADWGVTKHRHWLCGHVHHSSVKELQGVTVETFRTLAAADAYAAGHGYRAGRDLRAIVYHREHGEVERHRCDIGMIEDTPVPA